MKKQVKIVVLLQLVLLSFAYSQVNHYNYKRELKGISETWHKIILPNDILGKSSENFSDIRVFGFTEANDTIEAPYLLRILSEKIVNKDVNFKLINTVSNGKAYFFTFEIPSKETFNHVYLDFKQQNFDWRLKLEASQNLLEWFTVIDNYRILSIKNEISEFQFTNIPIPSSKFRYLRLMIDSKERPELNSAKIQLQERIDGSYENYRLKTLDTRVNVKSKQTEISIDLSIPLPVSLIKLKINDRFDYYRSFTIKYLSDSVKTEQGWLYNYSTISNGIVNSFEKNEFRFSSRIMQKIKISIDNHDNPPLQIDSVSVKGYHHELVFRINEKARYYLTYGNKDAQRPTYDIVQFADKIPDSLKKIELGNEEIIEKEAIPISEALFEKKLYLWLIMLLIIFVLGSFSFKMMNHN